MSKKARWKQISKRRWSEIAPVWVEVATSIPSLSSKPDPGLDRLPGLLALEKEFLQTYSDVPGLRSQVFWDAAYLYAKCDHVKVASERLAGIGMASWAMFNAYHSAYLGARSLLCLLGVPLPDLAGRQVFLDLFPEEDSAARRRRGNSPLTHQYFTLKEVGKLDQRAIWDCLQRVVRLTSVDVWDGALVSIIQRLDESEITPPRNHFLYKPSYWLFDDLARDMPQGYQWMDINDPVGPTDRSFLLWLCFAVHKLLTSLVDDLSARSPLISLYMEGSRTRGGAEPAFGDSYRRFCDA